LADYLYLWETAVSRYSQTKITRSAAQPEPRWRGSLQHNKLLAEKCHLGFASRMA
jgi:hypothetical protein